MGVCARGLLLFWSDSLVLSLLCGLCRRAEACGGLCLAESGRGQELRLHLLGPGLEETFGSFLDLSL